MNPPPWQDLLQRHLDGDLPAGEWRRHVPAGPDREAVERLLAGLDLLTPATPPAALAGRIAGQLRSASRRRPWQRGRQLASRAALVAALLLLTLGMRLAWPTSATPTPAPREGAAPAEAPATPLRASVSRAGSALAALTTETAGTTVENTSSLLPWVGPTALPPMSDVSPELDPPLEPFREASARVSTGLAPVTDSARRAVRLFLRDLPGGRGTANKPG